MRDGGAERLEASRQRLGRPAGRARAAVHDAIGRFAPAAAFYAQALIRDPRVLCLAAWLCLALALARNSGHYERKALLLVVVGFALLAAAAFARLRSRAGDPRISAVLFDQLLAGALVTVLLIAARLPPGWHVTLAGFTMAHGIALYAIAAVSFAVAFGPPRWRAGVGAVFIIGCIAAVALRLVMPLASPAPVIDVFVMLQESARNLLAGLNPYTVPVTDVYGGKTNYGYDPNFAYAYLPATLYPETLSYALFRDVRYAHLAAELLAALLLFTQARRRMGTSTSQWLTLIFLFHPRSLYVLENAWTEPLIIGAYALCDWLASRYPGSKRLAIAYGILLSTKLYLVYFALHALLLERRPARLLLIALAALATTLPFIIANPEAFIRYGVLFQLTPAFRPDALSLLAGLHDFGVALASSKLPAMLAGAACALYTLWRFFPLGNEGWRWATTITTWAIFLMGSQAFCNYYYFIGAMVLFTLAGACERQTATDNTAAQQPAAPA